VKKPRYKKELLKDPATRQFLKQLHHTIPKFVTRGLFIPGSLEELIQARMVTSEAIYGERRLRLGPEMPVEESGPRKGMWKIS